MSARQWAPGETDRGLKQIHADGTVVRVFVSPPKGGVVNHNAIAKSLVLISIGFEVNDWVGAGHQGSPPPERLELGARGTGRTRQMMMGATYAAKSGLHVAVVVPHRSIIRECAVVAYGVAGRVTPAVAPDKMLLVDNGSITFYVDSPELIGRLGGCSGPIFVDHAVSPETQRALHKWRTT